MKLYLLIGLLFLAGCKQREDFTSHTSATALVNGDKIYLFTLSQKEGYLDVEECDKDVLGNKAIEGRLNKLFSESIRDNLFLIKADLYEKEFQSNPSQKITAQILDPLYNDRPEVIAARERSRKRELEKAELKRNFKDSAKCAEDYKILKKDLVTNLLQIKDQDTPNVVEEKKVIAGELFGAKVAGVDAGTLAEMYNQDPGKFLYVASQEKTPALFKALNSILDKRENPN